VRSFHASLRFDEFTQVRGKIKEQWGNLTDDGLDVIAGKQDQLEGKLQQRYGYQRIKQGKKSTTGTVVKNGDEACTNSLTLACASRTELLAFSFGRAD
jgi:uncharacterized protein YjbJ (UPF0337 family)